MEISVKDFKFSELITVNGRVDQSNADQLTRAVEAAHGRGRYNLVIDMSASCLFGSAGSSKRARGSTTATRHCRCRAASA